MYLDCINEVVMEYGMDVSSSQSLKGGGIISLVLLVQQYVIRSIGSELMRFGELCVADSVINV